MRTLLKVEQHRKFHGDVFHVVCESMFVAFVQMTEVVVEEISSVEPEALGVKPDFKALFKQNFLDLS